MFRATGPCRNGSARVALIAGLALLVGLAFGVNSASAALPVMTVDPPSAEYTTAQVSGTIDTGGEPETRYVFQYSEDGGASWTSPSREGPLPAMSGPQNVSADLTGLKPGTEYTVRLGAENEATHFALEYAPDQPTFTTKAATPPDATIDPVTTFTGTTAHFTATIDVNAPAGPLSPAAKAAYRVKWHFQCTPECHGLAGGVVNADEATATISDDAVRLEANTFYEVRLVAVSGAGTATAGPASFDTPLIPVGVKTAAGASDDGGGYILQGVVTPYNSKVTDCHFEYGPTAAYVYEAPCWPEPTGRDEVQELHLLADGGHFKLSLRGQKTSDLPFDATAAEVETALQALPLIGPGGVSVSVSYEDVFGAPLATYVLTFGGPLSSKNVGELQLEDSTLFGSAPHASYLVVAVEGGNNLPVLVEAQLTGLTPNATYHFQVVATNSTGTTSSGDRTFIPTLPSDEEDCPNATLRAENNSLGLPECRAYEMVTSPFKGGFAANGSAQYADDGSAFVYISGGVFAGVGLGGVLNVYLGTRSDAGWKTTTYGASAPVYAVAGGPLDIAADFQSSLNLTRLSGQPSNVQDLYLRNRDGSFTRIGPGVNPAKLPPADPGPSNSGGGLEGLVGGSFDLSHVVYGVHAPSETYPGDTTQQEESLYEYVGTGHDRPRLVGLDNSGQLVSDCGTVAGGNQSKFNAVSTDGRVIFFSALRGSCGGTSLPATEIWARVDGATSYEVSRSHCTRAVDDPGGACNSPANAVFEGAAKDGSRVYFTTTQQLVNGDTDETSDLYAYDLPTSSSASPVLVEVSGASGGARVEKVARVSDDGSRVFFIARGAALAANTDALGESAAFGDDNLYVWRRDASHPAGQTTFVARLSDDDVSAETTANGDYLLLATASPLVETDTDNADDVYRYDADSGEMLRLSTDASGAGGNADGFDATFAVDSRASLPTAARRYRLSMSADATAAIFRTKEALSAADVNGAPDVYLWKAGQVSLVSGGQWSEGVAAFGAAYIDGSGDDVYFSTAEALTPADADTTVDYYDARIGGGFAFPRPEPCLEAGCLPPPRSSPPAPVAATDRPSGAGNVEAAIVSVKTLTPADRAKLANGGRVLLRVKVSRPGGIVVKGTAKIDGTRRQVFSAALAAREAGEVELAIALSKGAQRQLRNRGSLPVQLSVRFAGAAAKTARLKLTP
jgi:hypothetical protein